MNVSRLVAATLITGALGAPAAAARPAGPDAPIYREPDGPTLAPGVGVGVHQPPISLANPRESPTPVVQRIDDGFDWASAAIGAGVAGSLALLIGVGGTAYRQRHPQAGDARQA